MRSQLAVANLMCRQTFVNSLASSASSGFIGTRISEPAKQLTGPDPLERPRPGALIRVQMIIHRRADHDDDGLGHATTDGSAGVASRPPAT